MIDMPETMKQWKTREMDEMIMRLNALKIYEQIAGHIIERMKEDIPPPREFLITANVITKIRRAQMPEHGDVIKTTIQAEIELGYNI